MDEANAEAYKAGIIAVGKALRRYRQGSHNKFWHLGVPESFLVNLLKGIIKYPMARRDISNKRAGG